MGFDRAFPPGTRTQEVVALLDEDFRALGEAAKGAAQ